MVGTRKTRGTLKADEEFLESIANGQESNSGTALGTENPANKALEVIPPLLPTTRTTQVKIPWVAALSL